MSMNFHEDNSQPRMRTVIGDDYRLHRCFMDGGVKYASLNEYSQKSGIDIAKIVSALEPYVDQGILSYDLVGEDIFINTAPLGRNNPLHPVHLPSNLWEDLTGASSTPEEAYALWSLVRALEKGGWIVESSPNAIHKFYPPTSSTYTFLAIQRANHLVPLIPYPQISNLTCLNGLLDSYSQNGTSVIAIACDLNRLDAYTTACRQWLITNDKSKMSIMILEGPRFAPVILTPSDRSARERSVTISMGNN